MGRRHFFRGAFPLGLASRQFLNGDCRLLNFFQHRILHHLGVDHLLKLELVQRQHADHLHQSGCQHLALRDFEI